MNLARRALFSLLPIAFLSLTGCLSGKQIIAERAPELFRQVAQSANRQSDVVLVRHGIPSYLMLADGMIRSYPDNPALVLAAAQAYAGYAAVLEDEEQERAARLSGRAKDYARRALELTPPFQNVFGQPLEVFQKRVEGARKEDVPTLFWAGNIWGNWIAASGGPEAMADLPWVEALMERVLQLDPGYYHGGAHLFKAVLLSARPEQFGGSLKSAEEHFQKARQYGNGKFLMGDVYYAEYYLTKTLNREHFVSTLNRVLATPADIEPDLTLANTLAQRKAKKLLSRVDEFF